MRPGLSENHFILCMGRVSFYRHWVSGVEYGNPVCIGCLQWIWLEYFHRMQKQKKKNFCTFLLQPALTKYQFMNNFLEFLWKEIQLSLKETFCRLFFKSWGVFLSVNIRFSCIVILIAQILFNNHECKIGGIFWKPHFKTRVLKYVFSQDNEVTM